jgi:hypothetical protein
VLVLTPLNAMRFKMIDRRIKGAADNLYASGHSDARHLALQRLEKVLREIGFIVVKKPADEQTLRVYPVKLYQAPLLNPNFWRTPVIDDPDDHECLGIAVWSKGDRRALHKYLTKFDDFYPNNHDETKLKSNPAKNLHHGYFIIPVTFTGKGEASEINFKALRGPLRNLLDFLQGCPVSKAKK